MKEFFICWDPAKRVLTFLHTERPMTVPEVRSMMLKTEGKVSPAALQVWAMAEARYNYIKRVLLEDTTAVSVCVAKG